MASSTDLPLLDVFSGAGGLSIGLSDAGFSVAGAVELDGDACETFRRRHPEAKVFEGDIGTMSFRSMRDEIALVAGGPPCQPWSSGGLRLGESDPRDMFPEFLRVLSEVRAPAFLFENVAGLSRARQQVRLQALIAEFEALGYAVSEPKLLNAAAFGVPQKRVRLFVIGVLGRSCPNMPRPSFGPGRRWPHKPAASMVSHEPYGSPNPSVVTFAKNPDLRPDPYDGQVYNGGGRPIDLERPAPTLLASMGGNKTPWVDTLGIVPEYHRHLLGGGRPRSGIVEGARRITPEEAALLQTFPRSMSFYGRPSSQYRQIGNAVPPRLAAAIGRTLWRYLAG